MVLQVLQTKPSALFWSSQVREVSSNVLALAILVTVPFTQHKLEIVRQTLRETFAATSSNLVSIH